MHDYVSSAHLLPTNAVVKCSLPNTGFFGGGTCYDGVRCGYIFFVVDGRGNILYRRIVMMPREGWGFLYQVKQAVWVEPCCAARVWIGPTGGRGGVERVTARGNAMYWNSQSLTIRAMGQI